MLCLLEDVTCTRKGCLAVRGAILCSMGLNLARAHGPKVDLRVDFPSRHERA